MSTKTNNTFRVVMTAMMICLIMVAILFVRIPIPFTQGYVHFGDTMVFLAVLILGWKYGAVAAALGGMLGDLVGGAAAWAPWSLGIKGSMALILGGIIAAFAKRGSFNRGRLLAGEIVGMIAAGAFMVAGYYFAEGIMYGNWISPLLGVPWNIGQLAVGGVLAVAISQALCRTPAKSYFAYGEISKTYHRGTI